jgi:hypothetical protein
LCDLRPLGMFADLYTPANIFSICYKLHWDISELNQFNWR